MQSREKDESERQIQFSVFEGDLVNRLFSKIGLGPRHPVDLLGRISVLILITWMPMAVMTLLFVDLPPDAVPARDFFLDFAAYTQFFLGIPLFIVAERIISSSMLSAARDFSNSGVIAEADKPKLTAIENEVARKRKLLYPDLICVGIAFILACCTIGPELFWDDPKMVTWHTIREDDGVMRLTLAGAWEMFVALPIQIFWWVRWIWKIYLWYWYLGRISKFHLALVASHPDRTGGVGFLSEVQAKFAIVILAFGVSNILSTIGYKITVEHAPIDLPPVWGPVVGFVIGAPLIFLAPLLLFTKQLGRTKKRALSQFREKAMQAAIRAEKEWLKTPYDHANDEAARNELTQVNLLTGFYERIHSMRVVPFDLRSAGQLIGSAVGPMLPLLPYFMHVPKPMELFLEAITKWLHP